MSSNFFKRGEAGQSLIEVSVAMVIASIVLGALIILVLTSLKNAQFAQNQAKATKYTQEAIDQIKVIRDRDEEDVITYYNGNGTQNKFSSLWDIELNSNPCRSGLSGRYFVLNSTDLTLEEICPTIDSGLDVALPMDNSLTRQILIQDGIGYTQEKKVIVKVKWQDSSGSHESHLETFINKF